jgi:hypothetical protein
LAQLPDFVEELLHRLADALVPLDLRHGEVRIGDIPAFRRDLMLDQVILRSRAANAWPAVPGGCGCSRPNASETWTTNSLIARGDINDSRRSECPKPGKSIATRCACSTRRDQVGS